MILIADSGSTKCDWKTIDPNTGEVNGTYHTMGFNPFFHDSDQIVEAIAASPELGALQHKVTEIHYFGAACSSEARKEKLRNALTNFFVDAQANVGHDLLGAALAATPYDKGIICILGTGSNAGYYDGSKLVKEISALGYILGDEGSGSYMGKQLLRDYLYGRLPTLMQEDLENRYEVTRDSILHSVYHDEAPNVYLASFARYLSDNRENYYIRRLVRSSLKDFLNLHVAPMPESTYRPVHFIGSVAYFFEDILREICVRKHISVGNVIRQPIHNLTEYYREKLVSST